MTIRSLLPSALWLTIVALAANAAWSTAAAQDTPSTPTKVSRPGALAAALTPYTVVLQDSPRRSSGEVTSHGTTTIALRRDGAVVMRLEYLHLAVRQRIIELPTGVTVVVDDVRERRTSTWSRSGASFRARMDASRGCIQNDIGEVVFPGQIIGEGEVVAGHDTIKVQSHHTTFWFARDVGCANVKTQRTFPDGINEKVATLVDPGDPDAALFSVPDFYVEVAPSVFHEMDANSAIARELDKLYFERRPPW